MKTSKIITRANELKSNGFTHMASIVKSHFTTSYYHVVSIDDILKAGKWIPATKGQTAKGARCRIGINGKNIDWTITARK